MTGDKGTDLSQIKPGIARAEVEGLLGQPFKEWKVGTAVRYCLYEYDSGFPPDIANGTAIGLMAVMTGGITFPLFEVIGQQALKQARYHSHARIIVAYDRHDIVLGIFREFDALPPDGRSPESSQQALRTP